MDVVYTPTSGVVRNEDVLVLRIQIFSSISVASRRTVRSYRKRALTQKPLRSSSTIFVKQRP